MIGVNENELANVMPNKIASPIMAMQFSIKTGIKETENPHTKLENNKVTFRALSREIKRHIRGGLWRKKT